MLLPRLFSSPLKPASRLISRRGSHRRRASHEQTTLYLEPLEERTLLAGDFGFAVQIGAASSPNIGDGGVAVDLSDNVYVVGEFKGTVDFDPGPGTANLTSAGFQDIFVSKFDSAGNFVWAKRMGGASSDRGVAIAVDSTGDVYTTGQFSGTADFDPGPGTANLTGLADIFVSKLDSDGNFVWAKKMGSSFGSHSGLGIAVDSTGNVYTTGHFANTADFDPGPGNATLAGNGSFDIFVSKLDSAGNFVWAQGMGSSGTNEKGFGIAVDSSGNVYTTGQFQNTVDFDPGPGIANLASAGSLDIFISKLDSDGNFAWAKSVGSSSSDTGRGIAVDPSGNVYTTGGFEGTVDFDPGPGNAELSATFVDSFVLKFDSGGDFVWAKDTAFGSDDRGHGISVGPEGSVYTTGFFAGAPDFDPGPGNAPLFRTGGIDIFVWKLDSAGDFVWARGMGGSGDDSGGGIAVDASGNVYTTGIFAGTADFDPGPGVANLTSVSSRDVFVSKLTQSQPPNAVDDVAGEVTVSEEGGPGPIDITADILANDSDPDLDPLTVVAVDDTGITAGILDVSGGIVTFDPNGEFETLGAGDTANQTFTYTIDDGNGGSDTATVSISVEGENDQPFVVTPIADVEANEDDPDDTIDVSGVFDDLDASDTLTLSVSGNTNTALVSASIVGGNLVLNYQADQSGAALITVHGTDTGGSFAEDTITVTVLSATDQLNNLLALVGDLGLSGGNSNALTSKLNTAVASLVAGNITAGVNKLHAFLNQVNAFVNSGKLTPAQASLLIDAANAAITSAGPGGAMLVMDGTSTTGDPAPAEPVSDVGDLVVDTLRVSLVDSIDGVSADEQAALVSAIDSINLSLSPYGVALVEVVSTAEADIRIEIAADSAGGSAADGLLGFAVAGEITILSGWDWYTAADATAIAAGQYDFQTVVTHELGHSVGLDHSGDGASVMYGWLAPLDTRRGLTAQDLQLLGSHDEEGGAALRALLPQEPKASEPSEQSRATSVAVDANVAEASGSQTDSTTTWATRAGSLDDLWGAVARKTRKAERIDHLMTRSSPEPVNERQLAYDPTSESFDGDAWASGVDEVFATADIGERHSSLFDMDDLFAADTIEDEEGEPLSLDLDELFA